MKVDTKFTIIDLITGVVMVLGIIFTMYRTTVTTQAHLDVLSKKADNHEVRIAHIENVLSQQKAQMQIIGMQLESIYKNSKSTNSILRAVAKEINVKVLLPNE